MTVASKPWAPPRRLGRAAAAAALTATVVLVGASAGADAGSLGPPDLVPRWIQLAALYGGTTFVGWLGARSGRRDLLAGAGLTCLAGAIVSIAAFVFVLPALLFLVAAAAAGPGGGRRGPAASSVRALLVTGLLVGAGLSFLGLTETACWLRYDTPEGTRFVRVTEPTLTATEFGGGGPSAGGCDGGTTTPQGLALGTVLLVGAVGLAWVAASSSATGQHDEASPVIEPGDLPPP